MKIDNMKMEHRERLFDINYETGDYTELDVEISGMDAELRALNKGEGAVKMSAPSKGADTRKEQEKPHKAMGFVTVCAGEGLKEIFLSLGADEVISGGQTMNPSTADIMDAVDRVNADTVFVLPNNKNIILAAEQASKMESEKTILVVPSATIPQGIAAILNYAEDSDADENAEAMKEAIASVKSGEVTIAIRDTEIDGTKIKKNDYMAIGDSGILAAGRKLDSVILDMLKKMTDEETSLISLYYGEEVTEDDALSLQKKIAKTYPEADVELQPGGQPVYHYLLSVE